MKWSALEVLVLSLLVAVAVEGRRRRIDLITWRDFEVTKGDFKRGEVIVVDQNGHGNSTTVQGAVDMVPDGNTIRVKINILPGIYKETVHVPISKPYISFIGKPNETDGVLPIITNSVKASDKDSNGQELGSSNTATVLVESDYFVATFLTFENSAVPNGNGDQAVAFRIDGDKAAFYRVRFLGFQDTLWDNVGTHFFYRCHIEGSVDFICGKAKSLYEDCVLNSTRSGAIAAHEREEADDSGFSFVGCKIQGTGPTILGRAWGKYSRIIYSYCTMDDIIDPLGWSDWSDPAKQQTSEFGEYRCEGRGSNRTGRIPWSKSLKDEEAMPYLGRAFIKGYSWLRI